MISLPMSLFDLAKAFQIVIIPWWLFIAKNFFKGYKIMNNINYDTPKGFEKNRRPNYSSEKLRPS